MSLLTHRLESRRSYKLSRLPWYRAIRVLNACMTLTHPNPTLILVYHLTKLQSLEITGQINSYCPNVSYNLFQIWETWWQIQQTRHSLTCLLDPNKATALQGKTSGRWNPMHTLVIVVSRGTRFPKHASSHSYSLLSVFKSHSLGRTSRQFTIMTLHHNRSVRMNLREDSTCMVISLLNTS